MRPITQHIQRDLEYSWNGSGTTTTEQVYAEYAVKKKYPKAFLKRTTDKSSKYYEYHIRVRIGFLKYKQLGDKCYFQDGAWNSAYKTIATQ